MFGEHICACHAVGCWEREKDGSEVRDELQLEVLRGLDYLWMRKEDQSLLADGPHSGRLDRETSPVALPG